MGFNEKSHAFIAARYYRLLTDRFGARGERAFIHATQYYTGQRGRRMAQRAIRDGEELTLLVYGTGFLYNMVRIAAGTLLQVGSGKLSPGAVTRSLADGSRLSLGVTAPPQGLTLMRVFYDDDIAEAMPLFEAWARRCGG